ncbi:arginine-tRNA-protein transferase, partial [Xylariales sp. AK1849]
YQSLIDRCWRRSGSLLYRPNQLDACCPHYTLRLDASQCHVSRDQRQAINRFNRHITGDAYAKEAARLYPKSREESKQRDNNFDLIERIHEAEVTSLRTPPQPAHTFQVTLESDDFTEEKYAVFENYQRVVHQEKPSDISQEGFKRFLCDSPLRRGMFRSPDGRERQVGSFHQCYRLDGQLVAIGVLDLLPNCVSAVYFLYHESIHRLQPGKLGALQEIALAAEQGYRWWYSGFYIHTCPKMKYKIDFKPQAVLDPDLMVWVRLDKQILALFDEKGVLHFKNADTQTSEQVSLEAHDSSMGLEIEPVSPVSAEESGNVEGEEEEEEEDDDEDIDLPLLQSNMPGLPPMGLVKRYPLDLIPVRLNRGMLPAGDLFQWEHEDIGNPNTAKGMIAELTAMVGVELVLQWALDFRQA